MTQDISKLCGNYGGEIADPVAPVAYIRRLPESATLILAMNCSPVTVKVRPVWHRISFRLRLNPATYLPRPRPVPLREITPGAEREAA